MSIATLAVAKGTPYQIGYATGRQTATFVRANLAAFWRALRKGEPDRQWLRDKAREERGLLPAHYIEEIGGIAAGSELPFADLAARSYITNCMLYRLA